MLKKILDYTMAFLLAIGCLALFSMMLLTAADVTMRSLFNSPITAAYELSEILMGILSPIAILYCAYTKGHVCVDIFYEHFSKTMQRVVLAFANTVVLIATVLLAWQSWYLIQELQEFNLSSPTLDIPMWPVAWAFLVSFCLYIPIAFYHAIQGIHGGGE